MEDPRTSRKADSKVRDLLDYTLLRCAYAIQKISAYKLSLAELGALRLELLRAIKTAFYRGLIAQDDDDFKELWSSDNEKTDPYVRDNGKPKPAGWRLWNALKRRADATYASKRAGARPTSLLRRGRPE